MEDSVRDFFNKMDWEGGDYLALDYGLTSTAYPIPPEMAHDWDEIVERFHDLDCELIAFKEKWDLDEEFD